MKSFYELLKYKIATILAEERENRLRSPMSVELPVAYSKTVNAFGISRASASAIIKRAFNAITTLSGPEPIKLPTTENKVKELTNKLLQTHEFPQCVGTIHDTHIEIVELNEHYSFI